MATSGMVVVVVPAPEGTYCDGVDCPAPAEVSVSLSLRAAPIYRCAYHWPDLQDMLIGRGHDVLRE